MAYSLEAKLKALLDAYPAKSSLYCVDLTTGMPIAAIRENTRTVSASCIKLPVLLCALQEVMDGRLSLEQFVPVSEKDYCDDTAVFEEEYRKDGLTLKEMLYWMIVSSDNTATNGVLSLLGFDTINRYCETLGLENTLAQRKMLDFAAVEAGFNNYTSALDQFKCYDLLLRGVILTPELRVVAMDYLSRCRHMDGLQRYISDNVKVLHKPGGLDHLSHDAGVFLLEDKPYYLGIFTWDGPAMDGEPHQNRLIGKLSRAVYDYITKGVTP